MRKHTKNTWFSHIKAIMSRIKCGKRAKKMNFRFVGKISQKRLKKSLIFHQFSVFFIKKALFEIPYQIKGNNPTKTSKVLLHKNELKVTLFHSFSETCLGFLSNILPQISQKELFSEMKSQMSTQSICIEKTCFFIKNTKFHICIL